jgi:hypothetical protein
MQTIRTLIALTAVAAAGFTQAQEATPLPAQGHLSTVERSAVMAETQRALAAGQLTRGNEGPDAFETVATHRDRADVRAEALAARLSPAELARQRLMWGM